MPMPEQCAEIARTWLPRGTNAERDRRPSPPSRLTVPKMGCALPDAAVSLARRRVVIGTAETFAEKHDMEAQAALIPDPDPVWTRIRAEAETNIANEPLLGGLVHTGILHHGSLESALACRMAIKLASREMSEQVLREIADEAHGDDPSLGAAARADIVAVFDRDPACHELIQPMLYFKGFQAIQCYRVGNWLWKKGRRHLAYFVQMRVSEVFGVDVHPAATLGKGLLMDHAHSMVIGETAAVGDNVSMLHSVTLGGTGKDDGDRHPKIGEGVLLGAGAKVLGNIKVGRCSRIAAGSVVLKDIPCCKTVAGVPAKVVGTAGCDQPSAEMNQLLGSYAQAPTDVSEES